MMSDVPAQKTQPKPSNQVDLQSLTTFPHISSEYMSDRIRNKFREFDYVRDEKGKVVKDANGELVVRLIRDWWANMEIFTQDFRLGNLNKDEGFYVRHHIDLCSDILTVLPESFHKPALLLLERSICVVETSQSKNGFLRRMFNTFFQNSTSKDDSPAKRSFFSVGKKELKNN